MILVFVREEKTQIAEEGKIKEAEMGTILQ